MVYSIQCDSSYCNYLKNYKRYYLEKSYSKAFLSYREINLSKTFDVYFEMMI